MNNDNKNQDNAGRSYFSPINCGFRLMRESDREAVLDLMRIFYASEAVLSNGSEEIFNNDISECVSASPYASGYVFVRTAAAAGGKDTCAMDGAAWYREKEVTEDSNDVCSEFAGIIDSNDVCSEFAGIIDSNDKSSEYASTEIIGYAMLAHSYSTEFGRRCVWIEDLYLREEARGLGLASRFFDYVASEYPDALHRLEAENDNIHAMDVYRHHGFTELPYVEMIR